MGFRAQNNNRAQRNGELVSNSKERKKERKKKRKKERKTIHREKGLKAERNLNFQNQNLKNNVAFQVPLWGHHNVSGTAQV